MQIPTYIVDSFTSEKFKGNPAGVCVLESPLSETQMLNIANELGFSETAFVIKDVDKSSQNYKIRFFSPTKEIDLCGHATLASAKILFHFNSDINKANGSITFTNINGIELTVEQTQTQTHNQNQKQDIADDSLIMTFPAYQVEEIPSTKIPSRMLQALGISDVINTGFNKEINSLVIEIEDCQTLANLTPNFEQLVQSIDGIDGVAVTAISDKVDYDFESRYFWPWAGTNEDPVTGAIHTFLTTYWADKLSKTKMNALQCSPRSGSMQVELTEQNRVILTGEAQIILAGVLNL